jgi:hypothetical protein
MNSGGVRFESPRERAAQRRVDGGKRDDSSELGVMQRLSLGKLGLRAAVFPERRSRRGGGFFRR